MAEKIGDTTTIEQVGTHTSGKDVSISPLRSPAFVIWHTDATFTTGRGGPNCQGQRSLQ